MRLALACVLFSLPAAIMPVRGADLGIVVTGLLPETGEVRVVVKPEILPGEAEPVPLQALAAHPGGGQASTRFTGLAPGAYTIVVLDGGRALGLGKVTVAEPSATAQVALIPEFQDDAPIHPNAVEWHRRLR